MKIIFLDIDGVLIPIKGKKWYIENDIKLGQYEFIERAKQLKSDEAITQLFRVIHETGARIVISSTWKHNIESCKKFLESCEEYNQNLWMFVNSKTPYRLGTRSNEILRYINDYQFAAKNGWHIDSWVAVDDSDADMKPIKRLGKFVHVKSHIGFTKESADLCINMLNNNYVLCDPIPQDEVTIKNSCQRLLSKLEIRELEGKRNEKSIIDNDTWQGKRHPLGRLIVRGRRVIRNPRDIWMEPFWNHDGTINKKCAIFEGFAAIDWYLSQCLDGPPRKQRKTP